MAKKNVRIRIVSTWRDKEFYPGEDYTGEVSLAIPDQALTIEEIVNRYTQSGVEIPQKDMVFLGEDEIPYDWEYMSRIEQLEAAAELRRTIAVRKKQLADMEAAEAEEDDSESDFGTEPDPDPEPAGPGGVEEDVDGF